MKWPPLIAGTLGVTLLQTSAVPAFELLGVAPNLLLVTLCCWAVVRDREESLLLVPLSPASAWACSRTKGWRSPSRPTFR